MSGSTTIEIHLRFIIVIEVHNSNDSLAGLNTVKHQVNDCESPLIVRLKFHWRIVMLMIVSLSGRKSCPVQQQIVQRLSDQSLVLCIKSKVLEKSMVSEDSFTVVHCAS